MIPNKKCCQCKTVKPVSEFHRNGSKKDGYRENCKLCRRVLYDANRENILAYNVSWNRKNRDRIKYHNEKRMASIEGRAKSLWTGAKDRAKVKNLIFTLPIERIIIALALGVCERTGIKFDFSPPENGKSNNKFAPSLDRIEPNKGYTIDNVRIVVWFYNCGKSEYSHDEFLDFCKTFIGQKCR